MSDDNKPLSPEAAAAIRKVRRMMVVVMGATFGAVAIVLVIIGYRLSRVEGSTPSFADVAQVLPAGAKVLSTAVGEGRIVVTIEAGGVVELHSFDAATLKPLGRIRLTPKP